MMVTFAFKSICFIFGLFVGFYFCFCCMVLFLFAKVCLHVLFCLDFGFRVNKSSLNFYCICLCKIIYYKLQFLFEVK
jgi:hypothetical protein